jgi:hypothetical protein
VKYLNRASPAGGEMKPVTKKSPKKDENLKQAGGKE